MKIDFLEKIRPDSAPKFSANLYEWLSRHEQILGGNVSLFRATSPMLMIGDGLWVGRLASEFFVGRRLSQVLSFGAKVAPLKMPGVLGGLVEIEGFWPDYERRGLCAIDPLHEAFFEEDRWAVSGDTRVCRWCGHRQRLEARTKTIVVHEWVDLGISN